VQFRPIPDQAFQRQRGLGRGHRLGLHARRPGGARLTAVTEAGKPVR
jgi:hypothetical protein